MAVTSTVEIKDCNIIVTHKLAFIRNKDCAKEKFKTEVERIKKEIVTVWGSEKFAYDLFCTVEFKFEFVDVDEVGNLPDDVDPKLLMCKDGVPEQGTLGPEQSVGRWFLGNEYWSEGVAAHEVGHELGMTDKYISRNSRGEEVPTWVRVDGVTEPNPESDPSKYGPEGNYPRDGLAFTVEGKPKPADLKEIMEALNIKCPCNELIIEDPPDPIDDLSELVVPPVLDPEAARIGSSGEKPEKPADGDEEQGSRPDNGAVDTPWGQPDPVPPVLPGWSRQEGNTVWDHPLTPYGDADRPGRNDPPGLRPPKEGTPYGEEIDPELDLRPLIFVPGIMGSALRINKTNGKPRAVWPIPKTRLDMKPLYPGNPPTYPTGLYPEYYDGLVAFICKPISAGGMGHTLGKDFFTFAYDWTETNQISGARLKAYIEQKLAIINLTRRAAGKTPWDAMDVLNHSMGGLVTRTAHKYGAKMHRMLYLASPHYGSADAYFWTHPDFQPKFMLGGQVKTAITQAIWAATARPGNGRNLQKAFKKLAQSLDTSYELLPDKYYLDPADHPVVREADGSYTTSVAGTYYNGPGRYFDPQKQSVVKAMAFKEWLGSTLPGKHQIIFSSSHKTPKYAVYYSSTRNRRWYWGAIQQPHFSGDGTVPTHSAKRRGRGLRVQGAHTPLCNQADTHGHIKQYFVPER
jgi:hypothetical protein